ncbi:restriction endonuclease subunit S [Massilia sp. W12]|uniref:restriction endonuclease subunit S n=1 Tax=Massilia sp. W12 TaxID=3126507 RepID=UPI0030CA8A23
MVITEARLSLVRQTEFGLIPIDWQVIPLAKIGPFSKGAGILKAEANSGSIPCIRYGEIYTHHHNIIRFFHSYISEDVAKRSKQLKQGDILFACSGETKQDIGKCASFLATNETYAGSDIIILRPENYNSTFLGYALNSPTTNKQKSSMGQGDAVVHISANALKTIHLPCPPTLLEQEAIAEALSDADALVGALEQLLAKKRQIKQGAMQNLLTGKKRLSNAEDQWKVLKISEIATIQRGASPRPIDDPIWFDENSPIGWVRISDVTKSGMYLDDTTQHLSQFGVKYSRPVAAGSLIMSICATVGRAIITRIETCIHDGFVVFENLKIDQYFLYYKLQALESEWSKHGQTGSQMNLNTVLINSTLLNFPVNSGEQAAIAKILFNMDTEITALEAKLSKARQLKQAMMQKLLTGQIRLVPPNTEEA